MAAVVTILAFLWWWPVGVAALVFLIARRRRDSWRAAYLGEGEMFGYDRGVSRFERKIARAQEKVQRVAARAERYVARRNWSPTSGNHAFDEYREATLKRLEDEQREFHDFLGNLRAAKDRAEFDAFMADRRRREEPPHEAMPG